MVVQQVAKSILFLLNLTVRLMGVGLRPRERLEEPPTSCLATSAFSSYDLDVPHDEYSFDHPASPATGIDEKPGARALTLTNQICHDRPQQVSQYRNFRPRGRGQDHHHGAHSQAHRQNSQNWRGA